MSANNPGVKFAEKAAAKGADQIREASEKLGADVQATARAIEDTTASAANGLSRYQLTAIEMARANAMAALDCAQDIVQAKSVSELIEVWTSHSRKQFERFSEQARELTSLTQQVAGEAVRPLSRGMPGV
ncbi:MAG: phasin family protein [Pseudorhodoplanes sp.]|nr:phasin family protein [Pseudorhodoplanes sp.]